MPPAARGPATPMTRDNHDRCDEDGHLYAGVFAPERPGLDRFVALLQAATEDVVLPALSSEDHGLQLQALRLGEDLSREKQPSGLAWSAIEAKQPLERVVVTATRPAHGAVPPAPSMTVHGSPPSPVGGSTARRGRPRPSSTSPCAPGTRRLLR